MAAVVDHHLEELAVRGKADRRNGFYPRYLLKELVFCPRDTVTKSGDFFED